MLKVKSFLRALSGWMKPEFHIMNRNPKEIHGVATRILSCQQNFKSAPSAAKKKILTLF
jgi:hypothetical protein